MPYVSSAIEEIGPGKVLDAFGVGPFKRLLCMSGDLLSYDEAADIIHGLGLEITPDELSGEHIPAGNSGGVKYSLQRVDDGYQMTCTENAKGGIMVSEGRQAIKC